MRSQMQAGADGGHSIALTVPAELAPLSLAFVIHLSGGGAARPAYVTPLRGRHFTALAGMLPGSPTPLGPSLAAPPEPAPSAGQNKARGKRAAAAGAHADPSTPANFAVRCRGADRVSLVLLKPPALPGQEGGADHNRQQRQQQWVAVEMALDPVLHRTGDVWHVALPALPAPAGLCYGWRADGDVSWESGYRLQPDQVLLDPACPHLAYLPPAVTASAPLPLPTPALPGKAGSERMAVLSSLAGLALQQEGGGGGVAPGLGRALEDMRLLEVDVRTFAIGPKVAHPGTFLGVLERLDHVRAVGANTLVLTPCYATAQGIGLLGRAAVSYLAPDPQLSTAPHDPSAAAAELRAMVSGLHEAGVEVIAQFDFAFTAEGTDAQPTTLSLRGLDHAACYRHNGVLNCGHAAVRDMLMSALRSWAQEYGLDGFCFINAENMVQDRDGSVLDAPPLPDALCHDPLLSHLKLIALPSDNSLLPRGGVRGFPHWGLWQQRNLGFAADMVAFMVEGTPGKPLPRMAAAIAARLTGSPALFGGAWGSGVPGNLAAARRPAFGVNCITVLGRQLLADVALEAAEVAAAAQAAAGTAAAGEGPPSAETITKSLLAAVIFAGGVPLLTQDATADLEAARRVVMQWETQRATPLFAGVAMRLRRRLAPLLLPATFEGAQEGGRSVSWHNTDGSEPEWELSAGEAVAAAEGGWDGRVPQASAAPSSYLAMCVRSGSDASASSGTASSSDSSSSSRRDPQAIYLGLNPHPFAVSAVLPPPPAGHAWHRVVDSSLPPPDDATLEGGEELPVARQRLRVGAKAVVLLVAAVSDRVRLPPAGALPA
eukprot:scaffold18.g2052.t1